MTQLGLWPGFEVRYVTIARPAIATVRPTPAPGPVSVPRTPVPRTVVGAAAEELAVLARRLSGCRFLPGSWDKRFAHDMAALASAEPIAFTERQAESLRRLAHRYRKQLERPAPRGRTRGIYPRCSASYALEVRAIADDDADHVRTLVQLAHAGRDADFRALAGALGIVGDELEALWAGTAARTR